MMQNKSFDEHIKEQFGQYSPEVPAHIWDKIVAKKDRKKPGGWFGSLNGRLLALVALLAAGTMAGIYFYEAGKPAAHSNASLAPAQQSAPVTPSLAAPTTPGADKPDGVVQQVDNTATTPASSQSLNAAGLSTANNHSAPVIQHSNSDNSYTNRSDKQHKSTQKMSVLLQPGEATESEESAFFLNPSYLALQKLDVQGGNRAHLKRTWQPHLPIPCPTAESEAAGNKRYVEFYAGPDLAIRNFSDTGHSAYLERRKASTSPSLSYSAGLRYTKVFGNGMSVRTGINYSQINEKFTYTQGHYVQLVYIINANGDTTGSYTQTGTRYKSSTNKYRSIDIPLLIGYELGNGRLHANINAGAMVNVYSWQKGSQLDTANNVIDISTGKSASPYQFKTNMGIGFMGAVSVYYKLTENMHLLAEPYYRYNLSPASKPALTFKQRYNTAGLRLGVRFDF